MLVGADASSMMSSEVEPVPEEEDDVVDDEDFAVSS
jgi:hypothetical protein